MLLVRLFLGRSPKIQKFFSNPHLKILFFLIIFPYLNLSHALEEQKEGQAAEKKAEKKAAAPVSNLPKLDDRNFKILQLPEKLLDNKGQEFQLSSQSLWLVYCADMKPARKILEALEADASILKRKKVVYLADIHKMPSFVRWIVGPIFKSYDFNFVLWDLPDEITFPIKENGKISLIKLWETQILETRFLNNWEEVKVLIEADSRG